MRAFSKTKFFNIFLHTEETIPVLGPGENKYPISTHQSQRLIVPLCSARLSKSRLPEDSMMRSAYLRSDRFSIYWELFKITNFSLSLYLYIQDPHSYYDTLRLDMRVLVTPCTNGPDAKWEYNTNAIIIMTNTHHLDRLLCRDTLSWTSNSLINTSTNQSFQWSMLLWS